MSSYPNIIGDVGLDNVKNDWESLVKLGVDIPVWGDNGLYDWKDDLGLGIIEGDCEIESIEEVIGECWYEFLIVWISLSVRGVEGR